MKKHSCQLINDLLPLYAEALCSEESRKTVAEHLAECDECNTQLRKMNTEIHVKADDDISTIRRIKRRLRIEKVCIAAAVTAVVLIVLYLFFFWLLNSAAEMDYHRYGFADTVTVEQDANGDLWLVREGFAMTAEMVYPTLSDENGNHMGYHQDFDAEKKCGMGFTLQHRRIDSFAYADLSLGDAERSYIGNIDDLEVDYIFYYEAKTDTEHVLWERS